jgi:hypothetical protein
LENHPAINFDGAAQETDGTQQAGKFEAVKLSQKSQSTTRLGTCMSLQVRGLTL